jgi:hypothetical protein
LGALTPVPLIGKTDWVAVRQFGKSVIAERHELLRVNGKVVRVRIHLPALQYQAA